jgi:hypothetical protein
MLDAREATEPMNHELAATPVTAVAKSGRHAAEDGGGLFSGYRRPLTVGLVLIVTLVAFEALAVATVMPAAERDLGGLRLYGWAFSGFLLASLVGITWAGEEADRHGPASRSRSASRFSRPA